MFVSPSQPTPRVQLLADSLCERIRGGEFRTGDALPSERALAQEYGVAPMTLRRALSRLEARGLILRRHGRRTLVASSTERMTVAVLVGPSLHDETAGYYRALVSSLREEYASREWTFRVYDSLQLNSARHYTQCLSMQQQLRHDLANTAFDGLIEIHIRRDVWEVEPNPLPSVVIGCRSKTDVNADSYQINRDLVDHVHQKGCRRIAYFSARFQDIETAWQDFESFNGLFDACKSHDLPVPCIQEVVITNQDGFRSRELYEQALAYVRQWQETPEQRRPDVLIVPDDIVMHAISKAIVTVGISVPENLRLVSISNDMTDHHYLTPVTRYLISIREQIKAAGAMLECRMQGREPEYRPVLIGGHIVDDKSHPFLNEPMVPSYETRPLGQA